MTTPAGMATSNVHSEDRELIEKLARLQDMHSQILELRGLLPERLLRSTRLALTNPERMTPQKLAADLSLAANQGSKDLQRFKRDFHSEEMRELWQKTKTEDIPQGRDGWEIDYRDLLNPTSKEPINTTGTSNEKSVPSITLDDQSEDVRAVVKSTQEANPSIKIEPSSESDIFPLRVLVTGLDFEVVSEETEGHKRYVVRQRTNKTMSSMTGDVVKHLSNEHDETNLNLLLSKLISYRDLKFRACDKCQNIFDANMTYPMIRQLKNSPSKDDKPAEWSALHAGCAT